MPGDRPLPADAVQFFADSHYMGGKGRLHRSTKLTLVGGQVHQGGYWTPQAGCGRWLRSTSAGRNHRGCSPVVTYRTREAGEAAGHLPCAGCFRDGVIVRRGVEFERMPPRQCPNCGHGL